MSASACFDGGKLHKGGFILTKLKAKDVTAGKLKIVLNYTEVKNK